MLGVGDVADDLGPVAGVGPQVLLSSPGVAGDDGVGGRQDVLGGTVVLLQQDGAGGRVILLELLDVAYGGAAEGVDGLIGVADDGQLPGRRGRARPGGARAADELAHEDVLGVVGVLVLVDEHVAEATPVHLGDGGPVLEQGHGAHDEVVEVEGVGGIQPGGVGAVDLDEVAFEGVGSHSLLRVLRGGDELVLQVRDAVGEGLGGESFGVDAELAHDERDEAGGVGGVVDGECGAQTGGVMLSAQDAHAGGMEGGDPHALADRPNQGRDALAHLGGGLVGEGDRQDLTGAGSAGGEQVGDAVGEHPGLAGPGAGDDEQGRTGVRDGPLLGGVEAGEELGRVGDAPGGRTCAAGRGRIVRPAVAGAGGSGLGAGDECGGLVLPILPGVGLGLLDCGGDVDVGIVVLVLSGRLGIVPRLVPALGGGQRRQRRLGRRREDGPVPAGHGQSTEERVHRVHRGAKPRPGQRCRPHPPTPSRS